MMQKRVLTVAMLAALPLHRASAQLARTTAEDIIVIGRQHRHGGGLIKPQVAAKAVSTVSHEFIQHQSSLQNAYQYVALTPGANVAATDPYGLSEQGSISLRGLGQDELGYVLEGMPLNDIGYYTAYPSQFIDSENIDEISLAPGSADLDSPVISAAGGLLNISMLDPSVRPGGSVDLAYGSDRANREFVRLDSGLVGDTGARAFVSFSHTGADDWRGPGRNKRTHVDFKIVKDWGEGNRVSVVGTYHDGITPSYPLVTLAAYRQYGLGGPNVYDATYRPGDSYYWPLYDGTFRIFYMSAPSHFALADGWSFDTTPYWQYGYGNSPYGDTLTTTGNYQGTAGPYTVGIPNSVGGSGAVMANYLDAQYRAGFTSRLTYRWGVHTLVAGYWYDYADEHDSDPFSALSAAGLPADIWVDTQLGLIRLPNGKPLEAGEDYVRTQVNLLFIGDTLALLDGRLTLEAGFKEAMVSRDGTNVVPGPQYKAIVNSAEPLPRVAARYQIDHESQVFASVTTNFRTPSQATLFDTYYDGSPATAANTNLRPEYSISEEVGYRYAGPALTASIDLFNYNFTNRQIATLYGGSNINESVNAGGQTSRGVDVEAGTKPWHHVSAYVSGEYLHATIDNDLPSGTDYLPTAGRTAVRSPHLQAALNLTYDDTTLFGGVTVKYIGSQFATFMNDEQIPGHAQADATIGVRLPKVGLAARPEVRLNLINVADAHFLSGVANPTPNANTTLGIHGTPIAGTAPTYYVGGGFAAIVTARQAF